MRRKWRSLRSGFRRELLARSNKKPKPKTKQWKHFNKLLFLRDSENANLSDNEFDESNNNNSISLNHQTDNVTDDFSDLMQLHSPVPNLAVESIENGEIKLNIIANDKTDKQCQDVNENTHYKILQSNAPPNSVQTPQFYFVKGNVNGVSEMSQLLIIKKPDQTTPATITNNQSHQPSHHQPQQEEHTDHQLTKTIMNQLNTPILNHRTNEPIINTNSFKTNLNSSSNVQAPKNKKRKEESDDELDADDYFGRMVTALIKDFDQDERKSIRLAVLKLITEWSPKKNLNHSHENSK